MKHAIGLTVLSAALLGLAGCPGDDGGGDDTQAASSTGHQHGTTEAEQSTGAAGSTGGSTGAASSTGPSDPDSSSGGGSSSSDGGPACDPPVVGEWNACMTADGTIDNTLCNWMGNPKGQGFLTCLSSADIEGGNVCTLRDCIDACDCFDPPATGTAQVVCAPILKGGDNACGLDCSAGETCPDGMECGGGLCFWPPR